MADGAGSVDLNADVGEGFGRWELGDDDALLAVVTSANVACGFHAGDPSIIRRTCRTAAARGVCVGAQVSYPDLAGFGRRFVDMDPAELRDAVVYQLAALDGIARVEGTAVRYVKPHGALYHAVGDHEAQAAAVLDAIVAWSAAPLPVLGLPGSCVGRLAAHRGVPFVTEGFADRAYTAEGTLVPRSQPGALLTTAEDVRGQTRWLLQRDVRSICVHSDTPGAAALAAAVRAEVAASGRAVAPFAAPPTGP